MLFGLKLELFHGSSVKTFAILQKMLSFLSTFVDIRKPETQNGILCVRSPRLEDQTEYWYVHGNKITIFSPVVEISPKIV